jgi:hypothetical protein
MSLNCVYHKSLPFRVVEDDVANELVASGEWFRHPHDANGIKGIKEKESKHEKPIRQQSRKRCSNGEHPPEAA